MINRTPFRFFGTVFIFGTCALTVVIQNVHNFPPHIFGMGNLLQSTGNTRPSYQDTHKAREAGGRGPYYKQENSTLNIRRGLSGAIVVRGNLPMVFVINNRNQNWLDHEIYGALKCGGHVASILDGKEEEVVDELVRTNFPGGQAMWLGGISQESPEITWIWIDGSPWNTPTQWLYRLPLLSPGLAIVREGSGEWLTEKVHSTTFKVPGIYLLPPEYDDKERYPECDSTLFLTRQDLTSAPSRNPTFHPNLPPRVSPTMDPSHSPTTNPMEKPTNVHSRNPTEYPTVMNSYIPSMKPSDAPTTHPGQNPTVSPDLQHSNHQKMNPTVNPTGLASGNPTDFPTVRPTVSPTVTPSYSPTTKPTNIPTTNPSQAPSHNQTVSPTVNPTSSPTVMASYKPTTKPTDTPTLNPSQHPTVSPTSKPSNNPTKKPTTIPTKSPSEIPTRSPTVNPTGSPTLMPSHSPTDMPTTSPSLFPTTSPTFMPSEGPTVKPTVNPTENPTQDLTYSPSLKPSDSPTTMPTMTKETVQDNTPQDDALLPQGAVLRGGTPMIFVISKYYRNWLGHELHRATKCGGHLASILDEKEESIVDELVKMNLRRGRRSMVWLGGVSSDDFGVSWSWADGSPWIESSSKWENGKPRKPPSAAKLGIIRKRNGKWAKHSAAFKSPGVYLLPLDYDNKDKYPGCDSSRYVY